MPRPLKTTSIFVSALLAGALVLGGAQSASAVTTSCIATVDCTATFDSTGAAQTFTVPAGVTSITAIIDGAQGGGSVFNGWATVSAGGNGGETIVDTAVSPGDVLTLVVGAAAEAVNVSGSGNASGGYGGGGDGRSTTYGSSAGGGGGSFLFSNSGTLIAAAGGGGGGGNNGGGGGNGGGSVGSAGANGTSGATGGGAATASANGSGGAAGTGGFGGGGAGTSGSGVTSASGTLATGGQGGTGYEPGGGGGGGYHAGGGGGGLSDAGAGVSGGGGGGGSSYIAPSATSGVSRAGTHSGNGQIAILYTLPEALVGFDSTGGSGVLLQVVVQGTAAIAPSDPTFAGHAFVGWFTAASGGSAWVFSTPITGATTLYAHWTINSEAVTFASGGGSAVASQTVSYGDPAVKPADPTRVGYTFGGWFTAASGGTAWDFSTPVTAGTTLYAHWTSLTPVVTISLPSVVQGGTLTVEGTGFGDSEMLDLSIHSTPVHLATVVTNGVGAFTATVTIPASFEPGAHTLTISGGAFGPVDLAVTVTAAPTSPLAFTGVDVVPPLLAALALILAGGVLTMLRVLAMRRRAAR